MEGKLKLPASVLTVKIMINEDFIRISFPITTTFDRLKAEVLAKCGFDTKTKHCLKYEDEEGDLVTLASDADLREALHIIASTNLLKLIVVKPKPGKKHSDTTEPSAASIPVESATMAPVPQTTVHSSAEDSSKEERKRIEKELKHAKKALRNEMKRAKQAATEEATESNEAFTTEAPETVVAKEGEKRIKKECKCKQKREERAQVKEMKSQSKQQQQVAQSVSSSPSASSPSSSGDETADMAALQQQMEQLGFDNKVKNERVLKRHQGNLEKAVACLRRKQQKKAERKAMKAAKEEARKSRRAAKAAQKHKNQV